MIRLLQGYIVFLFLRLGLTLVVGWVALDYASERYEVVATALDLLTDGLH